MATAFKNFQSRFTESELSKLKSGDWCYNDIAYSTSSIDLTTAIPLAAQTKHNNYVSGTTFYYDTYVRLYGDSTYGYSPTLKCNGTIMNDFDNDETNSTPMYVGAITADEVAYAGGKYGLQSYNYYLLNEEFKKGSSGANGEGFWLLSPTFCDGSDENLFYMSGNNGVLYDGIVSYVRSFRPVVSLASSIEITSGDGTKSNPYTIK